MPKSQTSFGMAHLAQPCPASHERFDNSANLHIYVGPAWVQQFLGAFLVQQRASLFRSHEHRWISNETVVAATVHPLDHRLHCTVLACNCIDSLYITMLGPDLNSNQFRAGISYGNKTLRTRWVSHHVSNILLFCAVARVQLCPMQSENAACRRGSVINMLDDISRDLGKAPCNITYMNCIRDSFEEFCTLTSHSAKPSHVLYMMHICLIEEFRMTHGLSHYITMKHSRF